MELRFGGAFLRVCSNVGNLAEAAKPAPEEDAKAVGRAALNLFCYGYYFVRKCCQLFFPAFEVSTSQDEEPQGGDGKGG